MAATGDSGKPSSTAIPQTGGQQGLSTGGAIGIGIAIAVIVIALVSAIAFFCYRRHTKKKRNASAIEGSSSASVAATKMGASHVEENLDEPLRSELGTESERHEMSASSRIGELATKANTHELTGDNRMQRGMHELPGS